MPRVALTYLLVKITFQKRVVDMNDEDDEDVCLNCGCDLPDCKDCLIKNDNQGCVFILILILILCLVISGISYETGYNSGIEKGELKVQKQAVLYGKAEYIANEKGEVVWTWSERCRACK